jgi:glycosyltransferase involved in cell wall biosynthesis
MSKRVAVIGTVGVPGKYGGFETLAHNLVVGLGGRTRLTVYCSAKRYKNRQREFHGARLVYLPLDANGVQSIPYDIISVLHAVWKHDVLLVLGVSGAVVLPLARWLFGKRVVVNLDGIEWKREKWGKLARWFLRLSERVAVWSANAVIADNAAIETHVQRRYGKRAELIEYGSDHVRTSHFTEEEAPAYSFLSGPYAFTVCRIEPENNIHLILDAFAGGEGLPLVAVGNWSDSRYGRELRSRYAQVPHLHLLDPIYNERRLNALRSGCAVYVHGHSAGGTNPSLVEAMALSLPILAYDVVYNRATTEERAMFFSDAVSLRDHLRAHCAEKWMSVGGEMKRIARERYTWPRIVSKYHTLFQAPAHEG